MIRDSGGNRCRPIGPTGTNIVNWWRGRCHDIMPGEGLIGVEYWDGDMVVPDTPWSDLARPSTPGGADGGGMRGLWAARPLPGTRFAHPDVEATGPAMLASMSTGPPSRNTPVWTSSAEQAPGAFWLRLVVPDAGPAIMAHHRALAYRLQMWLTSITFKPSAGIVRSGGSKPGCSTST
jgi:hypothetical protein